MHGCFCRSSNYFWWVEYMCKTQYQKELEQKSEYLKENNWRIIHRIARNNMVLFWVSPNCSVWVLTIDEAWKIQMKSEGKEISWIPEDDLS